LSAGTIAVFPEYTGTWLVASGEKESAISSTTLTSAMTTVALTHLPEFSYYLATAPSMQDAAKWALFSVKATGMARDYQTVFGELSRRFGIHIVAGSIVLPDPQVVNGQLVVRPGGSMVNVSAVFGPDGTIVPPLVVKAFPIDEEQAFTTAGHAQELPVFNTPAGKLAVLICADSWFPEAYVHARRLGATLIAVPSFSSGDGIWQTPWAGYNGAPTASDVDRTDIGRITEGQAWLKYAMAGRAPAQGMAHGVNVFLRGTLWDLGSDGATVALQNGKALVGRVTSQAALTNLWLT
jgi:predicted amidohydrolase